MRKLLGMARFGRCLGGVCLGAALMFTGNEMALAADLPGGPYYTTPEPLSANSWAGPYLGATLGYEWGSVDNNPTKPSGIAGGVEAGYNWQRGAFVFGGETDIQLSDADDTLSPFEFSNPWFGTLRGRGGVAFNNVLLFGTAGFAYGDLRADSFNLTESHTSVGWTAGGGVEVAFSPRWSAKAEWLYLDLADRTFSLTGANNGLAADLLRMGVNYHF
ncbi:MAG: outer membrane protein [Xanthobacteraceae bacterium]